MLRKHYAGIIIIRRSDGKVLYQLRDDKSSIPTPNKWATFGGGIEKSDKSPREAIIREVMEELCYDIDERRLKKLITLRTPLKTYYLHYIIINDNEAKRIRLREGKEMKFMKREEYLRLKNSYWPTRQFIKYYLTNRKINKLLTNC